MKPSDSNKFKILNDMVVGKPDGEGPWDHELPDDRPMQVASKLSSLVNQYRKFGVDVSKVSASASVMACLMQSPNATPAPDNDTGVIYHSGDFDVDIVYLGKLRAGTIRIHGK